MIKIKADRTILNFKGLHIFGLVITTRKAIESGKIHSFIGCSNEEVKQALEEDSE